MSIFYDEMAQLVIDMLDEYGRDIPFLHTNPDTNVVTSGNYRGIYVDPKKYVIPDSQMQPDDHRIIVDSRVEPLETGRVDNKYIAFRVKAIKPADRVLGYTVDLRYG